MNSDIGNIMLSINKMVGEECALPGEWSPQIFYSDLMSKPVKSSEILISSMKKLMTEIRNEPSYLNFFFETRGYKKEITPYQEELFNLFNKGSIMLYFEPIFLKLIENPIRDDITIKFISALSNSNIDKWNDIVKNAGACCYSWYAKEHELYLPLLSRKDKEQYENYTDEELLACKNLKLEQIGIITPNDSRSKLIELLKK